MRGTNVAVTLGTCDSNTSSATGPQALNCVLPNVVDDPPGSWYWWEVLIEHSAAAVNAEFLGVIPTYRP